MPKLNKTTALKAFFLFVFAFGYYAVYYKDHSPNIYLAREVPHPAPNPAWAVYFEDLKVETTCGKTVESVVVVSHLGFPEPSKTFPEPFFLAPFETSIPIKCKTPSRIAIVGANGNSIFNNYTRAPLEPFRIEGNF